MIYFKIITFIIQSCNKFYNDFQAITSLSAEEEKRIPQIKTFRERLLKGVF